MSMRPAQGRDGTPSTRSPRNEPTSAVPASPAAQGRGDSRVHVFHESAGAVVFVDRECVVLQRGDEWVFPKGHLEAGETPEAAAVREVREETGLEARILGPLGSTRYEFDAAGPRTHRKRVHWFLAERVGGSLRPEPPFTSAMLLGRADVDGVLSHEADRSLAQRAFKALDGIRPGGDSGLAPREAPGSSTHSDRRFPAVVELVVEIPRGSRNKYEWDEQAAVLRLDRVLSSSVFYNFDYSYIVDTRAKDGDHTDALLLVSEPIFPGCRVKARPVGGLEMSDEHGFDFKVLCVAEGDALYRHVVRLDQIEPHRLREIENFFVTYKLLENKDVEVLGWRDGDRAAEVLLADKRRYEEEDR
jgi:inorganic pyrophosphatase